MNVFAFVLGSIALVLIILLVASLSYYAGKRKAIMDMVAIINSAIEPVKNALENAQQGDAPKE